MLKKMSIVLLSGMLALSAGGCALTSNAQENKGTAVSQEISVTQESTQKADSSEGNKEQSASQNLQQDKEQTNNSSSSLNADQPSDQAASQESDQASSQASGQVSDQAGTGSASGNQEQTESGSNDLFTNRDLEQSADLTSAVSYEAKSNESITITSAGVYLISGSAENYSIIVEADDEAKVQIVLDGLHVTNSDTPVIYVKNADKTFVTSTEGSENNLTVSGTFSADGDTNTDAVIFSKDDLVMNGLGTIILSSTDNGISCKDDLKITGGNIQISSTSDALEANESILIYDGNITIDSGKDALHAENDEDNTTGSIQIIGGTLNITASDDGVQATTTCQIDGGTLNITASEGIEGTYIEINDGTIQINASDDGINAAQKSTALSVAVEINGGEKKTGLG